MKDGQEKKLKEERKLKGYNGDEERKKNVIIEKKNMNVDIVINEDKKIGKKDKENIEDVVMEQEIRKIKDCEE